MGKAFIYVLRCLDNCLDNRLYIGSTRNIDSRIKAHKRGRVKTTKSRQPVELIYFEETEDYTKARKRELYLKSGTGRDWLKKKMEGCQSG
jgi:putative endonuclease